MLPDKRYRTGAFLSDLTTRIPFKGIVSRDFEGLQMILMDRIGVPDVLLEVYSFLNLHLHIAF